jgi:hypothetical protein
VGLNVTANQALNPFSQQNWGLPEHIRMLIEEKFGKDVMYFACGNGLTVANCANAVVCIYPTPTIAVQLLDQACEVLDVCRRTMTLIMVCVKKNTKRCELDSVGKIEDCFTALRFLWLKFYNNAFVYAFFAKVTAHMDLIKNEFGKTNFGPIQMFADHFVKQTKHDFFMHLLDGFHINDFEPFLGDTGFEKVLTRIRAWHATSISKALASWRLDLAALSTNVARMHVGGGKKRKNVDFEEDEVYERDPRKRSKSQKKREKRERAEAATNKNALGSKKQKQPAESTDNAHSERLAVATAMGFDTVKACASDFASKRKAASLPIECFWSTIAAEFGGPLACTNKYCPKCCPNARR